MTVGAEERRWRPFSARPWKGAVPALVGVLGGLCLILVGTKIPDAGISGFAETDYLVIETSSPFNTADLGAHNLVVTGLVSLKLPSEERLAGVLSFRIAGGGAGEEVPTSIPYFEIGAGSQISLAVDRKEERLIMTLQAEELNLRLIPPPGAQILIDGELCRERSCDFVYEGPQPLYLTAGAGTPLALHMDLDEEPKAFSDRIAVSEVQLWEEERLAGTVERRGAVEDGSLRFLEAPEQAVLLERGTVVDLDLNPAGLVLRAVEMRRDSVYLQLSGRVDKVSVEIGDTGYSLMPTRFDRLSRNPHVKLGLGILTILVGGGLSLLISLSKRSPSGGPQYAGSPVEGSPDEGFPSLDSRSAGARSEGAPAAGSWSPGEESAGSGDNTARDSGPRDPPPRRQPSRGVD